MTREQVGTVYGVALGVVLFGVVGIAVAEPEPASSGTSDVGPPPAPSQGDEQPAPENSTPALDVQAQMLALNLELADAKGRVAANERELSFLKGVTEGNRDGMSNVLAWIALIAGIVGVALPVFAFFVSILPARAAAEDARKTLESLDERFRKFIAKERLERIDAAVKKLSSEDDDDFYRGISILQVNPDLDLSTQVRNLCDAATNTDRAFLILQLIYSYPSIHVQRLLQQHLLEGQPGHRDYFLNIAAAYAQQPGTTEFRAWLKQWLVSSKYSLIKVFRAAGQKHGAFLEDLVNDDAFLALLSKLTKHEVFDHLSDVTHKNPVFAKIVLESALAKQFARTVFAYKDKDGNETSDIQQAFRIYVINGVHEKNLAQGDPGFDEVLKEATEADQKANR